MIAMASLVTICSCTKLLTIFLMCYNIPHNIPQCLLYFLTRCLYLLIPFIYFTFPTPTPNRPRQPPICSLYLWVFFHFGLFNSTYKWDHSVFVFLCLTYFTEHGKKKLINYTSSKSETLIHWNQIVKPENRQKLS